MLEFIAQSALEFEMAEHLGVGPYERTEERTGYRNGYKPRILITAVGDLRLLVPQDRDGTFSTPLFSRYQRSDKALVLAMLEMYVNGISTPRCRVSPRRSAAVPSPPSSSPSSQMSWTRRCPSGGAAPSPASGPSSS